MKNWPTKKLGEICDFQFGFTFRASEFNTDGKGMPVIRIGDIDKGVTEKFFEGKYENRYVVQSGDILISLSGTIKVARWSGSAALLNQRVVNLNNFRDATPEFIYYALPAALEKLQEDLRGTVVKNVLLPHLENLEIPLPFLSEQKRIVEEIEKLFAKIDEAEKLRWSILADSATLLPSALHQIFSRAEKEGWMKKELGEIAILNPKKTEIKELPDSLDVSFVPMAAVDEKTQTIVGEEVRKLGSVKKGYTYFRNGDVLFAKITPCMENGKVAIARNLKNGIGFGSTEFHVIRAADEVLPKWIFILVGDKSFRDEAERHMTGTAGQQRVPVEFLKNIKIPLPPVAEQKRIVSYLEVVSEKARRLQELQKVQLADFSALRQSVLHLAFQGELVK